jgi:hypothetical protein
VAPRLEAEQDLTFFITRVSRISLIPGQDFSALLNHE